MRCTNRMLYFSKKLRLLDSTAQAGSQTPWTGLNSREKHITSRSPKEINQQQQSENILTAFAWSVDSRSMYMSMFSVSFLRPCKQANRDEPDQPTKTSQTQSLNKQNQTKQT